MTEPFRPAQAWALEGRSGVIQCVIDRLPCFGLPDLLGMASSRTQGFEPFAHKPGASDRSWRDTAANIDFASIDEAPEAERCGFLGSSEYRLVGG